MTTYLVPCECGKSVPVEVGQAGGQVVCTCGKTVDVPTLRMLRHLPVAETHASSTRAAWDTRKGVVAAGLIAALVFMAIAGWIRLREPAIPEFPAQSDHMARVGETLDNIKPVDAWNMWVHGYRQLTQTGFTEFKHPHTEAIQQYITKQRFLQKVLVAIAALSAAIALAAAFWPAPSPRRR